MYKVAIIDDEPIIVEGLTKSINWEKWDCRVVATGVSGIEGISIVEKEKPNIIFSDIRMPHMDGLTLIASIKSQNPNLEVTILTGFSDFEYAREAIRLGVTRFLVKPSKMDELEEAVEVMVKNLKAKGILPDQELQAAAKDASDSREQNFEEDVETAAIEEAENAAEESAASSFIVNNAMKYMEENYREKLKLQDVADQVYVSQWHLSKLLNRYKGQSFSDILNNIRIEKARELLKDPSLRIGDIADMVGFLDMAHFSRVFKKQTGISANEYRNSLK